MIRWLLIVFGLVSLAPASKAQQITDCLLLDNPTSPETSPDHDVVFPTNSRDICVPSEDSTGNTIVTIRVELTESPTCVQISGAPSVVSNITLTSNDSTLLVRTGDLFSEADSGEFDLIVDGQTSTIEYGPKGIHLIGNDSFTVSQSEDFQLLVARSYFAGPHPTKKLCIENEDSILVTATEFELEVVRPSRDDLSCVSDVALTSQDRVLEYKIRNKDSMSPAPGEYHLLVADNSCEDALSSPIFTLHVEGSDTPTPGPTPLPPSDEPPRGGGTNVAAIVGGVAGGLIISLVIVFSVVIFIVVWRRRGPRKLHARTEDPAPGQGFNLDQIPTSEDEKPPSDDKKPPKQSTVVVLDIASNGPSLGSYLASKEFSQFEKFVKPGTEEDRGWYSRRANSILNTKDYRRLYIIYRGSPEELRESYPLVWGLRNEIKTRPYGYDVLQKVVFVQVVSSDKYKAGEDVTLVEGLHGTFIIAENKLDDAKELARLIYNKVTLRHSHSKVNNMTRLTEPSEDTDDVMHVHTSPESSPGPHTRVWGEQRPEDPFLSLPAYPTSDPPSYPSEQAPLSLSQVGSVPIPQPAEEPMQTRDSQNPLTEAIITLNITTEKVLGVLQEHGKTHEKIAEYTKQTAQHTAGMGETMEEIRQSANEASDNLTRENVSEDQQDVS